MGLDHLKKPKPPRADKPKTLDELIPDKPTPKEKKAKQPNPSQKPETTQEQVTFRCGHRVGVGYFQGRDCTDCQNERNRKKAIKKRVLYEKYMAKKGDVKSAHDQRLPDGSVFRVVYDAGSKAWSGLLNVPQGGSSTDFRGTASGVFRLLQDLDNQYRTWHAEQVKENPDPPVAGDGSAG